MAALSAVVMYDTCEVKVIHESNYADFIIPGCDDGYSLVEISEEPAAYIFNTINTLRTGAFKLFKCTFPGSKQFKSTFILCFFKYL